MKHLMLVGACLVLSASLAFAQSAAQTPPDSQNPDRVQIEATLQRYIAAYVHRSPTELLAVWPDLDKQKKEYGKIKHHFEDASVSDVQFTVQPLKIEPAGNGAVVQAERTEKFVKTETSSSITTGDLNMGNAAQTLPPVKSDKKKEVKKSDQVWITMQRTGDAWTIASISENKPR